MVHITDLLFLLALIVTASAKFPEIRKSDSGLRAAIKKVHQTWDPTKDWIEDKKTWNIEESNHHVRKKRSITNPYCDLPGYTGENCEFPICEKLNKEAQSHPAGGLFSDVQIDTAHFSRCNFSMYTVFDSEMSSAIIELDVNPQAFPDLYLYDASGNEVTSLLKQGNIWMYERPTPGLYTIKVDAPSLECFVTVGGSSRLVIEGGFVRYSEDIASDRIDFLEVDAYAGEPSTFVVHAHGLTRPGQIVTVTMFNEFNHVARPQTLLKRYGCAYEYFVESFYCREPGANYYYRIDGIDFSGNRFRRLQSFACIMPPPTTTPVPTTPDTGPKGCRYNGVLMNNTDGTTFCFCQGYYTGRDCGTNLCLNGGTPLNGNLCRCPAGFSGNHCEDVVCSERAGMGFGTNHPTMIFVVRAQLGLKNVIEQVADQIKKIITALEFDPLYLQHFGLLIFNKNSLIPLPDGSDGLYSDADDLINALKNAPLTNNTNCGDVVLTAISEAISTLALTGRSPVYVITDAVPNDEQESETIFHLNTYRASPIYVLFIEPPLESGCTMDVYHTGYQAMVDMTQKASGHVFVVPNTQTAKTGDLFFAHTLHTFYRSSLMSSTDSQDCSNRKDFFQPIRIDRSIKTIVVTATGRDLYLDLLSPGTTTSPSVTNFTLGETNFWWFENMDLGTWKMTVYSTTQNAGGCSARIYSTRISSQETTEYDLFVGYTPAVYIDAPRFQPVVSEAYSVVAHVNNYNVRDPAKVFAELIVSRELPNGRQEQVFLSNGIWRNQCDYELYFPPMTCTVANELLYVSVYIRDELGFMFQRSGVSYCSEFHPTPEPPSDCLHGGVEITINNGTLCFCTTDWTGTKCEIPVCHHGGTLQISGGGASCDCTAGHIGLHCETAYCTEIGTGEPFAPTHRDMAFVVELSQNSAPAVQDLYNYISGVIRDMSLHHPNWIANYYLTAYNSSWSGVVGVYRANQVDQFVKAVQGLYDPSVSDNGCEMHVWEALEETTDWVRSDAIVNLFHVSGQYQVSLPYFTVASAIYAKRITMNAFYGITGSGSRWYCNATDNDYNKINTLCEANGGRAYPVYPSNFYEVLRLIPSYFQNALVYVRSFDDCTTQQTVYFPIDSYTQSIQLTVCGYYNTINVFKPDGTQLQPTDFADIYNNAWDSGWRISEVRKPCDPNWTPMAAQYCALVVESTQTLSWSDASSRCRTNGGFLIDIVIEDTDTWIQSTGGGDVNDLWIGLNNIDSTDLSDFSWDQGDNADPIKLGEYKKWDANEPVLDQNKRCVLRQKSGKWSVRDCSEPHPYICFKHKYEVDFEPSSINDDDLPNGKWWVTVTSQSQPEDYRWDYKGCMVEVHVQSNIQVFPVFALNEHTDVPIYEPTTGTDQNRFITNLYGGEGSAILNYALFYDFDTLTMLASTTYEKRLACKYPWLSQTFSCPTANQRYAIIHTGEDQTGVSFQRMTTAYCPLETTNCNNGVPISGICVCDDYWTGRFCDTPNCVNGGTYNSDTNKCSCPSGYTGDACQSELCVPQVPRNFGIDDKTFGLVIEGTIPNKPAIQQLVDNLQSILVNISEQHTNWFTNYAVVFIGSQGSSFQTPQVALFVNYIRQQLETIKDEGTTCGAPLFGGLTNILSSSYLKAEGSVVFVLTRSTANDATTNLDAFKTALSVKKAQINYLVVDDDQLVCGKPADDDDVLVLSRYATETGGNFFILPNKNFMTFLSKYLPALYSSNLITSPTLAELKCDNAQWFAQVDFRVNYLYISMFAPPGTRASIYDPSNQVRSNIETLYSQNNTRFVRLDTSQLPGIYTIKVNAPNPCSVQVRTDSPLNVYAGFTQPPDGSTGSDMDDVVPDPVQNVRNVVNLHLEGAKSTIARLTYTELINPYDNTITVLQLFKRSECSYEYYSNDFQCNDQDFVVMVNGVDDYGINFRREVVAVAHCYNSTTPTF